MYCALALAAFFFVNKEGIIRRTGPQFVSKRPSEVYFCLLSPTHALDRWSLAKNKR
jgi:hypothetical protein